jgi:uncharacterized protein YecE (DUF72 family)
VLWQLPARTRFDAARLGAFLELLPRSTGAAAALAAEHDERLDGRAHLEVDADRPLRHALEVRHESFRDAGLVALLREHVVALVLADSAGHVAGVRRGHGRLRLRAAARAGRALHQRLHPGRARRVGRAGAGVARRRPRRARLLDNDAAGHAPFDAAALAARLGSGRGAAGRCSA